MSGDCLETVWMVSEGYLWDVQMVDGLVKLELAKSGQVKSGQVNSGQVKLGQVK